MKKKKEVTVKMIRESRERMKPIFEDISIERGRQDHKWGQQNHHPEKWLAILMEEIGEASKCILEAYPFIDKISVYSQSEKFGDYRHELIQVAAVAVAAIESIEKTMEGG